MDFIANWIWDDSGEFEKNYWLYFRKKLTAQNAQSATIYISADSRYSLYINAELVGRGPNRYWPFAVEYDTYDVAHLLREQENVITVEVNHYGTSTSQYIHQPGGLFLQLDIVDAEGKKEIVYSDETFKCKRSRAFSADTSRVNVSQPYVEAFDARKFDADWKSIEFDDSSWKNCILAQGAQEKKIGMIECDIEPLTSQKKYACAVIQKQLVQVRGTNITVDFQDAFYPNDTSTSDKLQTGYIAMSIQSPQEVDCVFTIVSKMWPFREERFSLNGEITVMGKNQKQAKMRLRSGSNLFILDVGGAYQRFYVDLHFDRKDIIFETLMPGQDSNVVAVGPFDYAEIGNICCAEGFKIDWDDKNYQQAIHSKDWNELASYREYIKPVARERIDYTNIKSFACQKDVIETVDLMHSDQNLVIANRTYTQIEPSQHDTEFVVDFGSEVSGFVHIEVEGFGTDIDIIGFEYMGAKPEIPEDLNNSMRYTADGKRRAYLFHRRAGFRYLLVVVRASTLPSRLYEVSVIESSFPVAQIGRFNCSDEKLNRIWEISKDTLRLCMEDVFVDCPGFEQAFWIGDARNTSLYQYYVYGKADIVKRSLLMAGRSLTRSDLPECHVPAGVSLVLPAWGLFWAIAGSEHYQYTGDAEFEKQIYPYIKKALDSYIGYINQDGLFEIDAWNMIDWSAMDTPYHGIVTHLNGLLVHSLRNTAEMANRQDDYDTAKRHLSIAQSITDAINRHLWNEENLAYVDCLRQGVKSRVISLLTNAILLLADCVPVHREEAVLLRFNTAQNDVVDAGSPFASFFKYEVLASQGQHKQIIEDIGQQWGVMLEYDASTCWETFIGFYKERLTRSYCHAWSSVPCYALGRYVLGVIPTAPGFSEVKIEPHTCGLQWAKGVVPTPHGEIKVAWQYENGELHVEYQAPKKIKVEVVAGNE